MARNLPCIDGNKRTAAVISETFVVLNGGQLNTTNAELVVAFSRSPQASCPKTR